MTGPDQAPVAADAGAAANAHVSPAAARPEPPLLRVVAALFVAGLAFRGPILIVGPLLPEIQADLAISHGVAGLLSAIPVLCMALLAPLGPVLAASIGPTKAVAACLAAVGGFGILRAIVPDAAPVILLTVGLGLGMGVVGPIMPMIVRRAAPRHPELGTGAYVVGYLIGATVMTAVAIPLAAALGGWRWAVGVGAAGAFASLAGWWLLAPHDGHERRVAPRRPVLPWRRPIAWLIGVAFGLESALFYGAVSWLTTIYGERGWSAHDAGNLTAVFAGLGIVATVAAPLYAGRLGSRRRQLAGAAVLSLVGAIGVATGSGASDPFAVPSVVSFGLGIGLFFPLALTLPLDAARSGAEASSLAALMLLAGYFIAAAAPVALGAIRDATGDFAVVGWVLVAVAAGLLVVSLSLTERRLQATGASPR